jgi:hypothetical protein
MFIGKNMEGGQSGTDRVDLILRVFNQKLESSGFAKWHLRYIQGSSSFKNAVSLTVILYRDSKFNTSETIDKVVCAEIPDPDREPELYAIVTKFMMHGPRSELNLEAPCMKMVKRTGK